MPPHTADERSFLPASGDQPDWWLTLGPGESWRGARLLSGEVERKWTFHLFAFRLLALADFGIDVCYEPLGTWDEVVGALHTDRALREAGLPPYLGFDIRAGLRFFESGFRASRGWLPLPGEHDHFQGRHSVGLAGVTLDGSALVFPNSWGPRWGENGLGYISRDYFEDQVDSVWLLRATYAGPTLAMEAELRRLQWLAGEPHGAGFDRVVEAWQTPNPIRAKDLEIAGERHEARLRPVFSVRDGSRIDVLDIRRDSRVVARAQVLHRRLGRTSVIEELYVPPSQRRSGYGRAMEALAVECATRAGSRAILLYLHEADADEPNRGVALRFAESSGYHWTLEETRRPVMVGRASKPLDPA